MGFQSALIWLGLGFLLSHGVSMEYHCGVWCLVSENSPNGWHGTGERVITIIISIHRSRLQAFSIANNTAFIGFN